MVQKTARKQSVSFVSTHLLVSAYLFSPSSFSPHPPKRRVRSCSPKKLFPPPGLAPTTTE